MRPKLVSFDCAQTLVQVDWQMAVVAVDSAQRAGMAFDRQIAAEKYDRLLRTRWPEFMELNLQRSRAVLDEFWLRLTKDWMNGVGLPSDRAGQVVEHAEQILFGSGSSVFQLYDDTLPCLERLRDAGYKMAVLSNWDNSLHRTLEVLGITGYFDVVVASLEEGVEKPDARLFQIMLERASVNAEDALHVGDNPIDDWQGAKGAGMSALVIDRDADSQTPVRVTSLVQVAEVLGA